MNKSKKYILSSLSLIALLGGVQQALGEQKFPPPEFETDYQMPVLRFLEQGRANVTWFDAALTAGALILMSWLVLKKRSRWGIWLVMAGCLGYFGFWKQGCVCPIGAIQNVSMALFDPSYTVPVTVLVIFLLPLLFALFSGRVFCAGVCPLGAIQDVFAFFPMSIPIWLEKILQFGAWLYLAGAVLIAGAGGGFIICRYDPFVPLFRMSGSLQILVLSGSILVVGLFIARPYCRFLCPYGVLLGWLSQLSRSHLSITPKECVHCRLCEESCPFNAIEKPLDRSARQVNSATRIRVLGATALVPVLMVTLGWAGSSLSSQLARDNYWVRLADTYYQETHDAGQPSSDMTDAFRTTGVRAEELYEKANQVQGRFYTGGWWAGLLLGLAVGVRLVRAQVYDRHKDYRAEPGRCLSCGRCFEYCPVDQLPSTDETPQAG